MKIILKMSESKEYQEWLIKFKTKKFFGLDLTSTLEAFPHFALEKEELVTKKIDKKVSLEDYLLKFIKNN